MPVIDELIAVVEVRDQGATQALERIEREALRNAQAFARWQAASGDMQGAVNTLRTALDNATVVNYRHGLQVETQIARYEQAIERTGKWNLALEALSGVGLTLSAAAIADVAVRMGEFVIASNALARDTERAQATLRVLTGGTDEYQRVLSLAREQQVLFGGSLAQNIERLSGLQVAARQSGADLGQLLDLAQRLAVLSPEQGIEGARVALAEALSGDPRSLAERFEIPRQALAALRDTSLDASDRLRVLDEYLNRIGVTSEAVAGAVPETTREINRLNAAWEELQITVGRGADPAIRQVSSALADFVQQATPFVAAALAVNNALSERMLNPSLTQRRGGGWGEALREDAQAALAATQLSAEAAKEANERIEQASERGARALERLTDAERRYSEQRADLIEQTNARILAIREQAAQREAQIVAQSSARIEEMQTRAEEQRASISEQAARRREDVMRRVAEQETRIEEQRAEALTQIAERAAEARARVEERLVETRRRVAEALQALDAQIAERDADLAERRAEARQEREERRAERRAELERRIANATTDEQRRAAEEALRQFEEREQREEERILRREQREEERRRREDAKRREELARRIAEAEAAAREEQQRIAAQEQRDRERAETRAREQRERLQRETQERLRALQEETNARLTELDRRAAQEIERERNALTARIEEQRKAAQAREEQEREQYARQEERQRQTHERQIAELRRALAEQIAEIVQAQVALGQITPERARERLHTLRQVYGWQPSAEREQAFTQLAQAFGSGVTINVQGVTDPQVVAQLVRAELLRMQRAGERLGL